MTEDLFTHAGAREAAAAMPLAARMRPRSLDEFSGHADLVGPGAPLRMALERDEMWSVVLWGSPGTGKTSLARIAAAMTERRFVELSAVSATVKDVRGVIAQAASDRDLYRKRTLVFLDEIHRFNKAQQDVLLPAVEDGVIALWGATTENPYFELNAPLLSRMRVLRLQPLEAGDLRAIVERALDSADGLGAEAPRFEESAIEGAVAASGGDARVALNWIESAAAYARERGLDAVDADVARQAALTRQVRYDRSADEHYDTISAYIKSVRGSDPDASLFWLAKMLEGGEAPEFIARRIVILASEDIGNADPQALPLAIAAASAVERLGLPEARYALAQATIYLAAAPKSNAAGRALGAAEQAIRRGANLEVPLHLRGAAHPGLAEAHGQSVGYQYPHDFPDNWVPQQYMPGRQRFYDGRGGGEEREMWQRLQERRARPPTAGGDPDRP
ncbi:MAG: replication-associated recombination protein A [Chloroflexi bacterium]|nr:replication-associated recombination protein A [Chloroflexota bacterium]